jgi:hypothetical protein
MLLDVLARRASTEALDEHGSVRATATTLLVILAIACTVALFDAAPPTALVASVSSPAR